MLSLVIPIHTLRAQHPTAGAANGRLVTGRHTVNSLVTDMPEGGHFARRILAAVMATASIVAALVAAHAQLAAQPATPGAFHEPTPDAPRNAAAELGVALRSGELPVTDAPMPSDPAPNPEKRSVALAGLLSAAVPGVGQAYAKAPWWRTVLYGAIEAAGWATFAVFDARNRTATQDFQNYADAHWSVVRYVDWVAANYQGWSGADVDKATVADALANIHRTTDPNAPAWEKIDFAQLNRMERAVTGGFSHTLPAHGDQQYYEEIGKYFQYRSGWDDHIAFGDTLIIDPTRVSNNNRNYVGQREDANSFGSVAVTAVGIVVVNHLVSAVDAMLAARHYNASLGAEMHGELLPNGERSMAATITLRVGF